MKISILKAIITNLFTSEKTGDVYFDVLTDDGTFKFSTNTTTQAELSKVSLLPVKIEGSCTGRVYEGRQSLKLTALTIAKLGATA